ncbi:MAG: hypothetical protein MUC50_09810 [Myxococcota bacterium]|jgi:hypothetical protein|nr:hypothetical protein [Myxococcota bacterium]
MRTKIILPNLLVIFLLGLGTYFYLRDDLRNSTVEKLTARVILDRALFDRSEALEGYELLSAIRNFAMSKTATAAFATNDIPRKPEDTDEAYEKMVRAAWFDRSVTAVADISEQWLTKMGKAPDLLFLTDRNGVVIARNTTPHACPTGKLVKDAIPTVQRALEGEATFSLWSIADSPFGAKKADPAYCQMLNSGLMEVASAPVIVDEVIQGILVVGSEVSNGEARKNAQLLGLDLAVLKNGGVYSSSLTTDSQRQALEQELAQADVVAMTAAAVSSGKPSETFEIDVEGESFIAIIAPSVSAEKKESIVNVVMASIDQETSYLNSLNMVLALVALCALAVIIIGFLLAGHFLKPVMIIEEGLLKMINGETNYRFDVKSSELGGLGYRINQLVSSLTGEEEVPDDTQTS